jgi:hypothetical protein
MIIDKKFLKELEFNRRITIPNELRKYLLVKYSEEPFPYEYSEQDLSGNILDDINRYMSGELSFKGISPHEYWHQEEIRNLKEFCSDQVAQIIELKAYITELEELLRINSLETPRMRSERLQSESDQVLF